MTGDGPADEVIDEVIDEAADAGDDLDALFDTLDSVSKTIENLLDRVDRLETASRAGIGGRSAGSTSEDEEAEASELPATATVDDALRAWVSWLIARYGLANKIPDRWAEVAGIPDDLAALRAAWLYAFNAETAEPVDGFEATQWHDALMRVLGRIETNWRAEARALRARRPDQPR